MIITNS